MVGGSQDTEIGSSHRSTYTYYNVDCINGSDKNDGITAPFATLDKVFKTNRENDLRIRFLSPGIYKTSVQHFSGLSVHWDGTTANGEVTIAFNGTYPNNAIQIYNCYMHFKKIRVIWNPKNSLYFDGGYCVIENDSKFVSGVVRFNGMYVYAENASFYRFIGRESYAKLHNIVITKPSNNIETAIHNRDGFFTIYGTLTIQNQINVENDAAIILSDRGRMYISTGPNTQTGYRYGIRGKYASIYIGETFLNNFKTCSLSGNKIDFPEYAPLKKLTDRVTKLENQVNTLISKMS